MAIAEARERFRVVVESFGRFKRGEGFNKMTLEEVDPAEEIMRDPVRWVCLDCLAELVRPFSYWRAKKNP